MNAPYVNLKRYLEGDELFLAPHLKGVFTIRARNRAGVVVREKEFENLILNQGLDRLAQSTVVFSHCQVGTGTVAPAETQTQLAAYVASSAASIDSVMTYGSAPAYVATLTNVYTFATGAVVGNMTEVGVGWGNTNAANLFSRALILDINGNPTSFPVFADEQLEVTYQIKIYPPVNDVSTTQNINGVPVNVIVRPHKVTSGGFRLYQSNFSKINASGTHSIAYSGSKVPITQSFPPAGSLGGDTPDNAAYVAGSYYQQATYIMGPSTGNGLIKTMVFNSEMSSFQVEYQTPINKTNTQTLILPVRYTWARR